MIIFAENFRGFKNIEIDTSKLIFLMGDNSSGKSSILYLINSIFENDLNAPPKLDEDFGADRYDYFSPYFKNANVTFGFLHEATDGARVAKIITTKKGIEQPDILICSYWISGIFLTIKKFGKKVKVRIIEGVENFKAKEAIKIHKSSGIFVDIEGFKLETVSEISDLLSCIDLKDDRLRPLVKSILSLDIKKCTLLSPIRAMPERFYPFRRRFDSRGLHFATMMIDLLDINSKELEFINNFGLESNLFDALNVEKITDEIENPPLIVTIEKNNKKFLMNQVGIGVSQIVPVLIESFFSMKVSKNILLTMQPELHLHPVAQAALGTYIHAMANSGLRGVFETHSSFLIDRFRSDMNANSDDIDAEIIFCEGCPNGNRAHHITIGKDGSIEGEPPSYHKFFVDELVRTIF